MTGGTGPYQYIYSVDPSTPGTVTSANTPNFTISPQPTKRTKYIVTVLDLGSSQFGQTTVMVAPVTTGAFDVFIPNTFTPNGDGVNDSWFVTDAAKNINAPQYTLNASKYELQIFDASSTIYFETFGPVDADDLTTGIRSREIIWDGNYRNYPPPYTGPRPAPTGTYYYTLKLYNCSHTSGKLYSGWIMLLR